jgi:hypothetical protein
VDKEFLMRRAVPIVCAVAAVGLSCWACYLALQPEPVSAPPFVVAPTDHDLGIVRLGEQQVGFAVTNPADHSRRIVGLEEG